MNAQTWRFDNANALYHALIDAISTAVTSIVAENRSPVIALPTGNTMVPFYRLAAEKEELLSISKWICFNLDEYYPVDAKSTNLSFKYYMDNHFYSRLKTPVFRSEILNGSNPDLHAECKSYEQKIKDCGGIDLAILGLGTNGHIAFNEPGSEFDSRTRPIELHPQTLMANFKGKAPFTHALTMGIGTILEAKQIFVVAHGKNKAQAVEQSLRETPTRTLPATSLQSHSKVTWFLDQEAASFI